MRVAVMLSGNGSNLQAIIDACDRGETAGRVCQVISDRADAHGLERARRAGIDTAVVLRADYPGRDAFEAAIGERIAVSGADLVVLAGFMRVLGATFVRAHAGRILNVHPSLLPKFRGLDTYRRALDAGEAWHGTSVHFVTEELDGGPVIAQARVAIRPGESVDSLRQRVVAREHVLYPRVVDLYCRGWLTMEESGVVLRGERLNKPLRLDEAGHLETA